MSREYPFKINGVALDGRSTLPAVHWQQASWSLEDVDSSNAGRNQKGAMIRDRVATKIKWNLEIIPSNHKQMAALLNAMSAQSFSFTYPDPRKDPTTGSALTTGYFYVGARSAAPWKMWADDGNGKVEMWGYLTFNLIEL